MAGQQMPSNLPVPLGLATHFLTAWANDSDEAFAALERPLFDA